MTKWLSSGPCSTISTLPFLARSYRFYLERNAVLIHPPHKYQLGIPRKTTFDFELNGDKTHLSPPPILVSLPQSRNVPLCVHTFLYFISKLEHQVVPGLFGFIITLKQIQEIFCTFLGKYVEKLTRNIQGFWRENSPTLFDYLSQRQHKLPGCPFTFQSGFHTKYPLRHKIQKVRGRYGYIYIIRSSPIAAIEMLQKSQDYLGCWREIKYVRKFGSFQKCFIQNLDPKVIVYRNGAHNGICFDFVSFPWPSFSCHILWTS